MKPRTPSRPARNAEVFARRGSRSARSPASCRSRSGARPPRTVDVGQLDVEQHHVGVQPRRPPRGRPCRPRPRRSTSKPSHSSSIRALARKLGWSSTIRTEVAMLAEILVTDGRFANTDTHTSAERMIRRCRWRAHWSRSPHLPRPAGRAARSRRRRSTAARSTLLRFMRRNRMLNAKYARLLLRLAAWKLRLRGRLQLDGLAFIGPGCRLEVGRDAVLRAGPLVVARARLQDPLSRGPRGVRGEERDGPGVHDLGLPARVDRPRVRDRRPRDADRLRPRHRWRSSGRSAFRASTSAT